MPSDGPQHNVHTGSRLTASRPEVAGYYPGKKEHQPRITRITRMGKEESEATGMVLGKTSLTIRFIRVIRGSFRAVHSRRGNKGSSVWML
jgi:hypothetical protein